MSNWTTPDFRDEQGGVSLPSGVETVILGPFVLGRYDVKSFTLLNQGPLTLSGARIEINPDHTTGESGPKADGSAWRAPNPGLWHTYDATGFSNLGSGQLRSVSASGSAYRWWRVVGLNTQTPALSVSGWLLAVSK